MHSSPFTATQLRSTYLAFFARQGHASIAAASLVPAHDPCVLFTTAGMHPLAPYLLGKPHPAGLRLASVQKCLRTRDIEAIGDDSHLTLFEMLGNWSLGDYGRDEAIAWSFEFLTGVLGVPRERLGATCFAGDRQVPADDESVAIWRRLGLPAERIALLGRDDNWWGPADTSGPCGPDTEIFCWVGPGPAPARLDVRDRRWVEIWNNVFMSHSESAGGVVAPLPRLCVDTGMGLERMLAVLNGFASVYEVDTVKPLLDALRGLASLPHARELRVLTDHVRAASFVIADGVVPSNKGRGYVLRRLVRRCILIAQRLKLPADWVDRAVAVLPGMLRDAYPEVSRARDAILQTLGDELARFEGTLARGLRVLSKRTVLDGKIAHELFQTYGFPFELTRELAEAAGKHIDEHGFHAALEAHRERSRATLDANCIGRQFSRE